MNDGANPVHHVLEKVHEVCDQVGVGLHLHVLDEPIERHLSVEFSEGDGVLWACAGAGAAGSWCCIVGWLDVVGYGVGQCWQLGDLSVNRRVECRQI